MEEERPRGERADAGSEIARTRARVAELEARLAHGGADGRRDLLSAVLETSVAAICVVDPEGRIVHANRAAEGVLGLPVEEVVGRRYDAPAWEATRIDGTPLPAGEYPVARVMRAERPLHGMQMAIAGPDGSRRLLSVNGAPLNDVSGRIAGLVLSFTDVTELLRAEVEVRERSEWLRMALEAARMGIWSLDVETGGIRWSDDVARLFGLGADALPSTLDEALELVHPEDRQRVAETIDGTLGSQAASFSVEHRALRPAGDERWLEARGRVLRDGTGGATGIIGTAMDVTERKAAELALRASEEALRTLLETVPSYIVGVGPDRRIRSINRTLPHLSVEEVIGEDVVGFMAEESREAYARALDRAFATGELQELRGKALNPEGQPVSFLLRMGPVKRGETVESVTIVGVDVTRLERVEEALGESQERLRRAQRLESIGRLAGGVAHDFNNLLTVVLGSLDVLEDEHGDVGGITEQLRPIREAAERGASLTRQLLAFARKQVVQPRVVDPNERIREAGGMLQRLIGEDVELRLELADEPWPVEIDPGQLQQVLVNLAINAREAMASGGILTIESRNARSEGAARPGGTALSEGDRVVVTVRDTGVGIGAESLPFIFEPFFSTKTQGTGLGLATCFGIVRQAGGEIEVESRPGEGTALRVVLPRSKAGKSSEEATADPPRAAWRRGTVLLVEDDAMVRRVTRSMLAEMGYEVLEAADGQRALELFRAHGKGVDLLVTDVVMPKLGGIALARELRTRDPDLDVLFVSGYSTELSSLEGLREGRIHLLEKPYSASTLAGKIHGITSSRSRAQARGPLPAPERGAPRPRA